MPVFEYKGVSSQGKNVSGVLDGESLRSVKTRLRKDGVVVLDIRESSSAYAGKRRDLSFSLFRTVRLRDVSNATRQLATLLSSSLPLMEALTVLIEQEENPVLKSTLSEVRDAVREGSSLANAFKAHPKVFSQLYINMVSAGELSGTLEITLQRLSDFLDEQVQFRSKLTAALVYPGLMSVVGMVMLIFIFTFVMPRVIGMFEDMKQQLPFITLALMAVVNFLSNFWWILLLVSGGVGYYLNRYFRTAVGKERLDNLLLHLPVFGTLIRMIAVSRFTRTLGTLLQNGVPALTALDIVKSVVGNTVLANAIHRARESVREGESIADPLRRSGLFPPVVVQMVSVGEKSGELEKMLLKISDTFDRTVETRIAGFMSLLEPVIILVMAVIIGITVVAILLPILEMSSAVK